MTKMQSGSYKGVDMKSVPYWSQPGSTKKGPGYVDPGAKAKPYKQPAQKTTPNKKKLQKGYITLT